MAAIELEECAKKTVDQATADYKVPVKFRGYVVSVNPQFVSVKHNGQAAYDELKK